jgi:hypothetical protein
MAPQGVVTVTTLGHTFRLFALFHALKSLCASSWLTISQGPIAKIDLAADGAAKASRIEVQDVRQVDVDRAEAERMHAHDVTGHS